MNVNYEYYRLFYYVCKYHSITRAANVLRMSQPNVTRALNRLEEQLGCKLLVRSTRGVTMTPEGEVLFAHVEIAQEQLQAGESELAGITALESGALTISASETALNVFLLDKLREFHRRYPGVRLRIANRERGRQYVVKSIPALLDDVEHGRSAGYGRFLTFVHRWDAFDEESRQLLQLLRRQVNAKQSMETNVVRSYSYAASDAPAGGLPLTGEIFDALVQLYAPIGTLGGYALQEGLPVITMTVQRRRGGQVVLQLAGGGMQVLSTGDIYYLETHDRLLWYHTTKGEFSVRASLASAEKQLAQYHFSRCNQCYLVNLKYVKAVENDFVHVNTDHLEISRRQRAAFLTAVASYIGGVL